MAGSPGLLRASTASPGAGALSAAAPSTTEAGEQQRRHVRLAGERDQK